MKRLFALMMGLMLGCGQANPGTISQHNPARYGTVSIRIDLSNITASELTQINTGIERAKALGPHFTVVTTAPDIELSKVGNMGCFVYIQHSTRRIVIGDQCFTSPSPAEPRVDSMIAAALAFWVGNQAVCRTNQIRDSQCLPCSSIGTGPAVSNMICAYSADEANLDLFTSQAYDAGGAGIFQSNEITQLDLDEFRRNHP